MKKGRPETVAEYISNAPKGVQKKLREMRAAVRRAAPSALEGIKWGMPALSGKRILVMYGAFKGHIGFYPTPSAIRAFAKELSRYHGARGSVQFPLEKPLPVVLIKKMTAFRAKEEREDAKWRTRN